MEKQSVQKQSYDGHSHRRNLVVGARSNSVDITSKLNDDDAIEILQPAEESVTSSTTGVIVPSSNCETNLIFAVSNTP